VAQECSEQRVRRTIDMACFAAPAAVAIVTTVTKKVVEKKEARATSVGDAQAASDAAKTPGKWSRRLSWLNTMLWGGVVLLGLEHIWHGEVVPWPPFLTAIESGEVVPMLKEMAIVGGSMTVAILVVWGIMVGVVELIERRANSADVRIAGQSGSGGGA